MAESERFGSFAVGTHGPGVGSDLGLGEDDSDVHVSDSVRLRVRAERKRSRFGKEPGGGPESRIDTSSETYAANRRAPLDLLAVVNEQLVLGHDDGGERYMQRHRARGKFGVRERIELLLDRDTALLELSPLAAWGSDALLAVIGPAE